MGQFVVATPGRTSADDHARALENNGRLRCVALGTRRGITGVPAVRTRLFPVIGLLTYASAKTMRPFNAESFRFRLHPWFDHWAKRFLRPGDHVISSYGYANECFKLARSRGGKTFLDGGNSHPDNFWQILSEEHRRWNCPTPPVGRHHYERSLAMMELVDYVMAPSSFVAQSFLARGFKTDQILRNIFPTNLFLFKAEERPRVKDRPLTLVNTGSLSLRKGTPYLLEAFRIVRKKIPDARLLLTQAIQDDVKPVLARFNDLPIEWSPPLPHAELAERLRSADIFVLPSLEDGFARTVTEALACGLPAIVTPNTGASDLVQSGINGEVVPIRDAQAIADAIFKWTGIVLKSDYQPRMTINRDLLTFEHFEKTFIGQLRAIQLI